MLVLQGERDVAPVRVPLPPRSMPYVLLVGRAPDSDVMLQNRSVSGRHARIEVSIEPTLDENGQESSVERYQVTVRDSGADGSGSRFGTLVGEQHLKGTAAVLIEGDKVCFGTAKYGAHFRLEPATEADEQQAERARPDRGEPRQGHSREPSSGPPDLAARTQEASRGASAPQRNRPPPSFAGPHGEPLQVRLDDELPPHRTAAFSPSGPPPGSRGARNGSSQAWQASSSSNRGAGNSRGEAPHDSQDDRPWRQPPSSRDHSGAGAAGEHPARSGGGRRRGEPEVTLAFPTADGVVVRDSRDPWPEDRASGGFDPSGGSNAGRDSPASDLSPQLPQQRGGNHHNPNRAYPAHDSATGLSDFEWQALSAEREACGALLQAVDLGLAGMVPFAQVKRPLTGENSNGALRPDGSNDPIAPPAELEGGAAAAAKEAVASAELRAVQAKAERLDHELAVRSKQVKDLMDALTEAKAAAAAAGAASATSPGRPVSPPGAQFTTAVADSVGQYSAPQVHEDGPQAAALYDEVARLRAECRRQDLELQQLRRHAPHIPQPLELGMNLAEGGEATAQLHTGESVGTATRGFLSSPGEPRRSERKRDPNQQRRLAGLPSVPQAAACRLLWGAARSACSRGLGRALRCWMAAMSAARAQERAEAKAHAQAAVALAASNAKLADSEARAKASSSSSSTAGIGAGATRTAGPPPTSAAARAEALRAERQARQAALAAGNGHQGNGASSAVSTSQQREQLREQEALRQQQQEEAAASALALASLDARATQAERDLRMAAVRNLSAALKRASQRGVPTAFGRWRMAWQEATHQRIAQQRGGSTLGRAWHRLKLGRARDAFMLWNRLTVAEIAADRATSAARAAASSELAEAQAESRRARASAAAAAATADAAAKSTAPASPGGGLSSSNSTSRLASARAAVQRVLRSEARRRRWKQQRALDRLSAHVATCRAADHAKVLAAPLSLTPRDNDDDDNLGGGGNSVRNALALKEVELEEMKSEVTRLQEALLAAQEYADAACHALEASRGERALAASQAAAALVEQVRKLQAAHDAAIQKEREARASAEAEASKRAEEAASAAQAASQEADSLRSMRDEARAQLALNEAQRMAMEAEGAKQTASQAKDLEEMRNKVAELETAVQRAQAEAAQAAQTAAQAAAAAAQKEAAAAAENEKEKQRLNEDLVQRLTQLEEASQAALAETVAAREEASRARQAAAEAAANQTEEAAQHARRPIAHGTQTSDDVDGSAAAAALEHERDSRLVARLREELGAAQLTAASPSSSSADRNHDAEVQKQLQQQQQQQARWRMLASATRATLRRLFQGATGRAFRTWWLECERRIKRRAAAARALTKLTGLKKRSSFALWRYAAAAARAQEFTESEARNDESAGVVAAAESAAAAKAAEAEALNEKLRQRVIELEEALLAREDEFAHLVHAATSTTAELENNDPAGINNGTTGAGAAQVVPHAPSSNIYISDHHHLGHSFSGSGGRSPRSIAEGDWAAVLLAQKRCIASLRELLLAQHEAENERVEAAIASSSSSNGPPTAFAPFVRASDGAASSSSSSSLHGLGASMATTAPQYHHTRLNHANHSNNPSNHNHNHNAWDKDGVLELLRASSAEASRCRRERDEWQRRCVRKGQHWTALESQAKAAQGRLVGERLAAKRANDALLAMVAERDNRLASLQHELTNLARGNPRQSSDAAGGTGGATGAAGGDNDSNSHNMSSSSSYDASRRQAAEALRDHMARMQREDAARAALMVRALATGFAAEGSAPNGAPAAAAAAGSLPGSTPASLPALGLLSSAAPGADLGGATASSVASATATAATEVARLQQEVVDLRDAAAEADAQGGAFVVAEVKEICSSLQQELAGLERRHAQLIQRTARGHIEATIGGSMGNRTRRLG